jgi:hypothetical protein
MTVTDHTHDLSGNRPVPDALLRLHEQNVAGLNGAVRFALDGAQASLDRYNEIVSEAHRRFAVLMWRGTLSLDAANDGTSPLIAQRAISTYLAHAAELAEIATKLQLECATIFQHRS